MWNWVMLIVPGQQWRGFTLTRVLDHQPYTSLCWQLWTTETSQIMTLSLLSTGKVFWVYNLSLSLSLSPLPAPHLLFSSLSLPLLNNESPYPHTSDPETPPKASAGPSVTITLPQDTVSLDGSKSADDFGIVSYQWERSSNSPAAGVRNNNNNNNNIITGVM